MMINITKEELDLAEQELRERFKKGEMLSSANIQFWKKSAQHHFFNPLQSKADVLEAVLSPVTDVVASALFTAGCALRAIYLTAKAISDPSDKESMKNAAGSIAFTVCMAVWTAISPIYDLLQLISRAAVTLTNDKKDDDQPALRATSA